jgi:hypothetical protein
MRDVDLPDNRSFGIFAGLVCAVAAAYCYYRGIHTPALALIALASAIALVTMVRPDLLLPLNKAWMGLGLAIGAIVNPIVLGLLFFGLITPVAFVMRLFNRDELRLRDDHTGSSVWRLRDPAGPGPSSFRSQY